MFMAIGAEAKKPWNGYLSKGKMPNPQFQATGTFSSGYGRGSSQQKRKKTSGGGDRGVALDRGRGMGLGTISKMYLMNVFI